MVDTALGQLPPCGHLHIAFNMNRPQAIGPLIIEEYGPYRMFIIYTVAGVVGFFVSYLAGVAFTLGASAAVCGLIGAASIMEKAGRRLWGYRL
jgi:rhomboid protease GluP